MHRIALTIYAFSFAGFVVDATVARGESENAPRVSFVRDVAPILVGKCQGCHGTKTAESNYRLDTFELMMQAGDFGLPPVTAGSLDESEFHRLIISDDPEERMPNNGDRLTDREIELIDAWIAQGATFDGTDRTAALRTQIPRDLPHPAAPATYSSPLPIVAIAFGVGVVAGLGIAICMQQPRQSPYQRAMNSAMSNTEQFGRQMLNALANYLPDSVSSHLR